MQNKFVCFVTVGPTVLCTLGRLHVCCVRVSARARVRGCTASLGVRAMMIIVSQPDKRPFCQVLVVIGIQI
jgi:hypothetical protein